MPKTRSLNHTISALLVLFLATSACTSPEPSADASTEPPADTVNFTWEEPVLPEVPAVETSDKESFPDFWRTNYRVTGRGSIPGDQAVWTDAHWAAARAARRLFTRYHGARLEPYQKWAPFQAWPLSDDAWVVALYVAIPDSLQSHSYGTQQGFGVVVKTPKGWTLGPVVPSVSLEGSFGQPEDVYWYSTTGGDFLVWHGSHGGNGGSREALQGYQWVDGAWKHTLEWHETTSQENEVTLSHLSPKIQAAFARKGVDTSEWATHWDYYDFGWSVDSAGVLEIDRRRTAWKTFCRLSEPTKLVPTGELEFEGYGNDPRRLRRYPGVRARKGG